MTKIFIAENIPSLNKGEMTILEGMLESFTIIGEAEVAMLSSLPDIDQPRYGRKVRIIDAKESLPIPKDLRGYSVAFRIFVSLLFMSQHLLFLTVYKVFGAKALRVMTSEIWKEYVKSDVIIVGHNSAFGMLELPYLYYLYLPFFAKMLDKHIIIYGGSFSRFKRFSRFGNKVIKFVLSKVDLITLRENDSYRYLKDIGLQGDKVFLTADPAFLLQPASLEQVEGIMRREGIEGVSRPLIGMTVTREIACMAFPVLNSPESSYHKHIEMLAQVIDDLIGRLNATVIFIPHCLGFTEKLDDRDDRIVAADIFQLCNNKDKVKVITNEYGPGELKGLIGQFDLFIGERLHSVINAMTMYVPSIAMSYSSDQRLAIIKMLGQENAVCHVENLDADALISKICNTLSEAEKIKRGLKSETQIVKERAMLNAKLLKELLDS